MYPHVNVVVHHLDKGKLAKMFDKGLFSDKTWCFSSAFYASSQIVQILNDSKEKKRRQKEGTEWTMYKRVYIEHV